MIFCRYFCVLDPFFNLVILTWRAHLCIATSGCDLTPSSSDVFSNNVVRRFLLHVRAARADSYEGVLARPQ